VFFYLTLDIFQKGDEMTNGYWKKAVLVFGAVDSDGL
jgi:hypothetical protein